MLKIWGRQKNYVLGKFAATFNGGKNTEYLDRVFETRKRDNWNNKIYLAIKLWSV